MPRHAPGTQRDAEAAYMLDEYVKLGSMRKVHELHPDLAYTTIVNRIHRGLDSKTSLAADAHRKIQDEHLDMLMSKLVPAFERIDIENDEALARGTMTILRVLERRAKLHGLDAAQQVQVSGEIVTVSDETARLMKSAQERLKIIADAAGPPALKAVEEKSA